MNRQRILTSLAHKEPDCIPRDLGGTESSGITAHALNRLNAHLNINKFTPRIFEPYQYVAYIPEILIQKFGIDTINLTPGPKNWIKVKNPAGFDVYLPEKWLEEQDDFGNTVIKSSSGNVIAKRPNEGIYFDPVNPPLAHLEHSSQLHKYKESIYSFDWPFFADEGTEKTASRAQEMHSGGRCVIFNLCCHLLAASQLLRGFENSMMDMIANESMFIKIQEYLVEGYLQRIDKIAPVLRPYTDVILLNDDLGSQNAPMIPLDLYRKLVKPYQQILFSKAKKAFNAPILFHSCGAVGYFIPDLIEAGIDALNPVQVSAAGMGLKELKKYFGSSITFWGGGIDTQSILNKSDPDKIRDNIRETLDIMAPGGGFVFCQVHNIQPDVPPENIVAMFEALDEFG
ncbi:MAG: uroporphyrinogen decarboxylase family protein [bacterium]